MGIGDWGWGSRDPGKSSPAVVAVAAGRGLWAGWPNCGVESSEKVAGLALKVLEVGTLVWALRRAAVVGGGCGCCCCCCWLLTGVGRMG